MSAHLLDAFEEKVRGYGHGYEVEIRIFLTVDDDDSFQQVTVYGTSREPGCCPEELGRGRTLMAAIEDAVGAPNEAGGGVVSSPVHPNTPLRGTDAPAVSGDFAGATVLRIDKKRWEVRIHLRLPDGTEETMVASADAYYTDHDGIWFDTAAETEAYTSW